VYKINAVTVPYAYESGVLQIRGRWGGEMWKDAVPLAASERTTNPPITETLPTHIHRCVWAIIVQNFSIYYSVISLQYEFTLKYVKLRNNNNNNNNNNTFPMT
jgi:hypothetical protein